VRSQNGKPGRIRMTASSDGLQAGEARIESAK
jgi:hypothetical protein